MSDKITVSIDKAVDILCNHLRECDFDELADIAGYISGAKLSDPEDSERIGELFEFEVGENYCGMFDEILRDENGESIII